MTTHNLMAQLKLLQELARERVRELQMRDANHLAVPADDVRGGCGVTVDGPLLPTVIRKVFGTRST